MYITFHGLEPLLMTIGDSIITIAIIGGIIYGIYLVTKKKKWKLIVKISGGLFLILTIAYGGFFLYQYQENKPKEATSLSGITLGMKKVDVTLAKGRPDKETLSGSGNLTFSYEDNYGQIEKFIFFDEDETVKRICSFEFFDEVFGLGEGDSYEKITNKLGEPAEKSINEDGTRMLVTYPQYNVGFELVKERVNFTCVTNEESLRYINEYNDS